MLEMFDKTFIQNISLRFPGRLIFGIAEPFDLILHFAFSFWFLENFFRSYQQRPDHHTLVDLGCRELLANVMANVHHTSQQ